MPATAARLRSTPSPPPRSARRAGDFSHARQLDSALDAAEATVRTKGGASATARADIQALRQAVAAERRANGGEVSEASYRALHGEVQALHQRIETLPTR